MERQMKHVSSANHMFALWITAYEQSGCSVSKIFLYHWVSFMVQEGTADLPDAMGLQNEMSGLVCHGWHEVVSNYLTDYSRIHEYFIRHALNEAWNES